MDYVQEMCTPATIYMCFAIAQIIFSVMNFDFWGGIKSAVVGVIVVAAFNFLCKAVSPVVSWVLLLMPLIFVAVIAALFGFTYSMATMKTRIDTGCQGDWCMKGKVTSEQVA
jgi:hypothetical protein